MFLVLLIAAGYYLVKKTPVTKVIKSVDAPGESRTSSLSSPKEEYLFVPYWTLDQDVSASSQKLIYFGIMGGKNGVDKEEEGYKNLSKFVENRNSQPSYLAIRMLNTETNMAVLKDKTLQEKIISDALDIALKNKFSGIILDFETQGLPFETLLNSITAFNSQFAKSSHEKNLTFGTLLFGDTFYRVRPYNVLALGKSVDRVYIMSYDFSKAKGDPGPNFPLQDKKTYGYDLKTMSQDFVKVVPAEKLTIIFGMFGYDWKVDEKGRGKSTAESKTTLQMEKFLTACISEKTCQEDSNKNGTKITYKNEEGDHIVWYENESSVSKKREYLHSIGLDSVGYWAYSYF